MEQNKFEVIWKVLKENTFKLEDENSNDVICTICKKIMINACNGPCGCRYCLKCITKHLNESERHCPGDMDDCKEEIINIARDLQIDRAINMKISKIIVKCPEKDCNYKDELRKIESHMRLCDLRQINCPYFNIGCKQINMINHNMENHFQSEIISHSKLLLECIDHLKNEIGALKKDIIEVREENKSLKVEAERINLDGTINQLKKNEKINTSEVNELNQEIMTLRNENRSMKEEIKSMKLDRENKEETILAMQTESENQTLKIDEMKQKLEQTENKQVEMRRIIDEICDKNADLIRKLDNHDETIKKIINSKTNNSKLKMIEMEREVEKANFGEFQWKIENFSKQRKGTHIYSEPFYSRKYGYKMGLDLRVYYDHSFDVYLYLMAGEFDDSLSWPCQLEITIDIINQCNSAVHKSITITYVNNRNYSPQEINSVLITTGSAKNSPVIIKNDQIIIKCRVT